jgi:DNA-binding GntR family transcriptional regulator
MGSMKITRDRIPDKVLREIFPKKFDRSLAPEKAYSQVKQMILSGKFKKGQKLLQDEIAQALGINKMAIAIALSRLKKEGLITSKISVGFFIV